MKLLLALSLMFPLLAKSLTQKEYEYKYDVGKDHSEGNTEAIEKCLKNWGHQPFGKDPKFRRVKAGVKVFGLGSKGFKDDETTGWPQLILVSPGVNVLGKVTYHLMNPNGWYCIKANVTVLSKSVIEIACKTHLTSSGGGAEVLGGSDDQVPGGVAVLGKIKVTKVGCVSE